MKVKIIIACLLMILATNFAYAKDIHVPGDFDKIQDALNAALPGDRVLVAAGTYEENITLKSAVELIGAGADVTKIMASTGTVVTADSVSFRTKIDGFTIDGVDKSGDGEYGIYCSNGALPTISNVTITSAGSHGIYCSSSSSPSISNVTITSAGEDGIYCYSSFPTISNVTISNTEKDGIHYESSSPTISNVTITNTGGIGIYCSHSPPTIIDNVTITNTGEDGIVCNNSSPTISNVTIIVAKRNGIYSYNSNSKPKIRGSVISQNSLNGIEIVNDSLPDIGTEAEPGENSIFNNAFFDVLNQNPTEVKAELNWWGQSPPNPTYFSGKVDYDPWLTNPPFTGSIYGTVTDVTGNPIKFAVVIAIKADTKDKYKAFTDSNGDYEIPDLPAGTYLVICIKKGYKTGIKKVEVPSGGSIPVDFKLTPSLE